MQLGIRATRMAVRPPAWRPGQSSRHVAQFFGSGFVQYSPNGILLTLHDINHFIEGKSATLALIPTSQAHVRLNAAARSHLADFVRPMVVIAEAEARANPELSRARTRNGPTGDANLANTASGIADLAENPAESFAAGGMPAGFVAELHASGEALIQASQDRNSSVAYRIEAMKGPKVRIAIERIRVRFEPGPSVSPGSMAARYSTAAARPAHTGWMGRGETTTGMRVLHAGRISAPRCRHFVTALELFLRVVRSRGRMSRSREQVSGLATSASSIRPGALRSSWHAPATKGEVLRGAPHVCGDFGQMTGAALPSWRTAPEVLPSAADANGSEWGVSAHFGQLLRGNAQSLGFAGGATGVTTAACAFVYSAVAVRRRVSAGARRAFGGEAFAFSDEALASRSKRRVSCIATKVFASSRRTFTIARSACGVGRRMYAVALTRVAIPPEHSLANRERAGSRVACMQARVAILAAGGTSRRRCGATQP
jgi:hypothetical protein